MSTVPMEQCDKRLGEGTEMEGVIFSEQIVAQIAVEQQQQDEQRCSEYDGADAVRHSGHKHVDVRQKLEDGVGNESETEQSYPYSLVCGYAVCETKESYDESEEARGLYDVQQLDLAVECFLYSHSYGRP
jgi:hypothetical protein